MATYYQGYRNVLKGRNSNDSVHPYKGVGTYSNWDLHNTSHILDGAPNEDHEIGTGRHPHGLKLSRLYKGLENNEQPLKNAGSGARLEDHRYNPWLSRAAGNNKAFKAGYGHAPDTPVREGGYQYGIVDYEYDGVTPKPLSGTFGHAIRGIDAEGTANSFGRHNPFNYGEKGVTPTPLEDPGVLASTYELDDLGTAHKRVNEWFGVPSSKALNI